MKADVFQAGMTLLTAASQKLPNKIYKWKHYFISEN